MGTGRTSALCGGPRVWTLTRITFTGLLLQLWRSSPRLLLWIRSRRRLSEQDQEYDRLREKLSPLDERLKRIGYHFGLHLTCHPKRYEAYYGHTFLFSETKPESVAEKLTAFVESTEQRHAGYCQQNPQDKPKPVKAR